VLGRLLNEPTYNFETTHLPLRASFICTTLLRSLDSKVLYTHSMLEASGVKLGLTDATVGAQGGKHAKHLRLLDEKTEGLVLSFLFLNGRRSIARKRS